MDKISLPLSRLAKLILGSALFCLPNAVLAQSAYELRLGMHKRVVERTLNGALGEPNAALSTGKERWYRSPEYDLVFCNDTLIAFSIILNGDLATWATAVESSKAERGEPKISWGGVAFGEVEAEWRVAPYQTLSISMVQYRNGDIEVRRWMQDFRRCDAPPSL